MVQESYDYLIWNENELDYQKAVRYFANSPYGIIYVKDKKNEAVKGIITIGEVVNGMCEERLLYKSPFVYASLAGEAIEIIENRINIHTVPVLDKHGRLLEQYQEKYNIPARFINGILLKLGNDENGDYAAILRDLNINEVRLIVSFDSDIELVWQIQNKISERNIDVNVINFKDFLNAHVLNRENSNVLWVDTGADYLCQRLRRYLQYTGDIYDSDNSRFIFLKDFMNFVNVSVVGAAGYEKYIRNVTKKYAKVAIYAPKKISEKIKNKVNVEDITDKMHITVDAKNERFDCQIAGEDREYDIILFFDLLNTDNRSMYMNGYYLCTDCYFINCEYFIEKKLFCEYLPILEKNDVKVYFLHLNKYKEILSAAKIESAKFFRGNLEGQVLGGNEDDAINFLGYDRQTGFELYHEIIGDSKEIKYMKNMHKDDIFYAIERNPNQIFYNDRKSIHIFGFCLITGAFVKEDDTIASVIKKKYPQWNVYNHGSLSVDLLETSQYYGHFKKGDIIVIMPANITSIYDEFYLKHKNKIIDVSAAYLRIPNLYDHIWGKPLHCNHIVMQHIAEYIMEQIGLDSNLDGEPFVCNDCEEIAYCDNSSQYKLKSSYNNGLRNYLDKIKEYKREGTCGAIVMNCNPFTKGHRYLIEEASSKVDYLYVFVVEEDKSDFAFKDRLMLVKQGCSDLANVIVIPSGKYIISALTLPGYFEKDELQDTVLDASSDLEIFADVIAPVLNIKKRFVGTEPTDRFTEQYNSEMKRILPLKGIELIEIARLEIDGNVVSASSVRELFVQKQFERLKKLVPECTFHFLTGTLK